MTFAEIIPHLVAGDRVRREGWGDSPMVYANNELGYIFFTEGHNYSEASRYSPPMADLTAADWEVIEETFDFAEALRSVKKGGGVRRKCWPSSSCIIGTHHLSSLIPEDVTATDWVIFKD